MASVVPTIRVEPVADNRPRATSDETNSNSQDGQQLKPDQLVGSASTSNKNTTTTTTTRKITTTTLTSSSSAANRPIESEPEESSVTKANYGVAVETFGKIPTNGVENRSVARVEDLGRRATAIENESPVSAPAHLGQLRIGGRSVMRGGYNLNKNNSINRDNINNQAKKSADISRSSDRNENVEGNANITTISTIAVQSGPSRIVLALLKDGPKVQLKIQELQPPVFEVGANYKQSLRYFDWQQNLMKNLRKHQEAPIEAWMSKFKDICASKEPNMSQQRRLVYLCMAENLQASWRALLNQLDKRSQLLNETCRFYESADQLVLALDKADHHVQMYRQEFLDGRTNSLRFQQVRDELEALNEIISSQYLLARRDQERLIDLIGSIGAGNLGDARANHLLADAQNLINYIGAYLDPLVRRKIQLESVITTSNTMSTTTTTTTTQIGTNNSNETDKRTNSKSGSLKLRSENNNSTGRQQLFVGGQNKQTNVETKNSHHSNTTSTNKSLIIRQINNFNDLNLIENWLNLKIDQLNSSLLSSLGISVSDSRSILNKHEQILLECRSIEEATLTFKGKNIHAIKSLDNHQAPIEDQNRPISDLFEGQKLFANKVRNVITILEARIVLLKRTIDFYLRSKEATNDIGKMMRRLQVDNSLQSVQFVSNELEFKDVSSVVASGATIISELQQLQLAQQQGQRLDIINLNLITNGIRAIIDQLNQDLAHLKTVLNQRRLVLLNEDASKMGNNFSSKCQQLHHWLNQQVRSYLLANNRLFQANAGSRNEHLMEVKAFCDNHEQLRVALQNKTLEVEALLKSLPTLMENFGAKNKMADEIERLSDELRQDWISTTNCLDRRLDLGRRYALILTTVTMLDKELNSLDKFKSGRARTPDERTDDDIKENIEQSFVQLTNQVRNFEQEARRVNTELIYITSSQVPGEVGQELSNDLNKQQLIEHANKLLAIFSQPNREQSREKLTQQRSSQVSTSKQTEPFKQVDKSRRRELAPAHKRPQQVDPPRFTRMLTDKEVEPFSTVELECETDGESLGGCQIEWFMNNFKRIPASIKHQTTSEKNQHKLTINNFSPICCGTYQVRASNSAGQAVSQCRLRLLGIKESNEVDCKSNSMPEIKANQRRRLHNNYNTTTNNSINQETLTVNEQKNFQSESPATSTSSSSSQWRSQPSSAGNGGEQQNRSTTVRKTSTTDERTISRVIQGVESRQVEDRLKEGHLAKQSARISQLASESDKFPVTQTTYSGTHGHPGNGGGNQLRVSYIDSPVSSASLSRSISKSPLEGTPQPPVFVQGLSDSMPHSCSRAGLVCLLVGNPPPTIEWLHNNTTIATTKCAKSNSCPRANICKLTIETVDNRTRGEYICKASNRLGKSSTGIVLTKESPAQAGNS